MRAPPSHSMPPVIARISIAEPKSGCTSSSPTSAPATSSGLISARQLSPIASRWRTR